MIHSFFWFFFIFWTTYGRVSKLGITQNKPSLERVHCKTTTKGLFFRPLNLEDRNIGKPGKITESWDFENGQKKLENSMAYATQLFNCQQFTRAKNRAGAARGCEGSGFDKKRVLLLGSQLPPDRRRIWDPCTSLIKKNVELSYSFFISENIHFKKQQHILQIG